MLNNNEQIQWLVDFKGSRDHMLDLAAQLKNWAVAKNLDFQVSDEVNNATGFPVLTIVEKINE